MWIFFETQSITEYNDVNQTKSFFNLSSLVMLQPKCAICDQSLRLAFPFTFVCSIVQNELEK